MTVIVVMCRIGVLFLLCFKLQFFSCFIVSLTMTPQTGGEIFGGLMGVLLGHCAYSFGYLKNATQGNPLNFAKRVLPKSYVVSTSALVGAGVCYWIGSLHGPAPKAEQQKH